MKIAMWSGPRNLSTAMMYSFGARSDCAITDEPFYASYLKLTGTEHPMREEVLASQSQDPQEVANHLISANPGGSPYWYQKHMAHHMVPGVPRDWMREVCNVFLIRHPARVIASYVAKREAVTLDDIGFRQQVDLYHDVKSRGGRPVVIDSSDIRANPTEMMEKLCHVIGVPWSPQMLSWPKGGHQDDGAWAPHWYGSVWNSAGFSGAEGQLPMLSGEMASLSARSMPYFEEMSAAKL